MKQLITTAVLLFSMTAFAQVGINNTSPKATLDITAKTNGTKPEGLIIPQLTGDQIRAATTATPTPVYGSNQKGLIIYATVADSAPAGATANITAPGYYYFDGSIWQKILGSSSGDTTNDAWTNDTANTLVKIGTKADGTARAAGTDFVATDAGFIGIGTAIPVSKLNIENDNNADAHDDITITTYSTTATPSMILTQSRGTKATPANLQNGDIMGGVNFRGRANGTFNTLSFINSNYKGDGTTLLSDLNFSTSGTTKMRIDENGRVGIGTSTPNTNAALDISSTTRGVKLPSMALTATNSASPLSTHVAGMLVYNTATAGTAPNNVVPGLYTNDGTQWILLQTPQTVNVSAPAGTVSYTAASTVPAGYLECNGTAISRTTYATLFAAIGTTYGAGDGSTTFNLPDLRGEFVRGWDHGRGVDVSRSLGSSQTATRITAGGDYALSPYGNPQSGLQLPWSNNRPYTNVIGDDNGEDLKNRTDAFSSVPNASPNTLNITWYSWPARPRNISLMPIIKY
ncbi:phage tail protein [Chryseobacterium sp. POE27]|uniref:phage tail protein n=1 Tax=Chryseobacterium sp. POE27 TaxID=3138177 RepID=UPI00321A2E2D